MSDGKKKAANIILDLSIKKALETRGEVGPNHDVILPWWFKRNVEEPLSKERMEALQWAMNWLHRNAPEESEHIYSESDGSQNIVINPMVLVKKDIQEALFDAGFKLMTEEDLPEHERTDVWDRIRAGSNFSDKWH